MSYKNDSVTFIDKLIETKKISHAFLFEVDELYTTKFALNIVKQILKTKLSTDSFLKICDLIDSDNFPELKIIRPDGKFIKKEQLSQLMYDLKNKPVYSDNFFYIIEFAENLNNSSANSILKFLPNLIVSPCVTICISVLLNNLCSSNLLLISPAANLVAYIGTLICFRKYGIPPI